MLSYSEKLLKKLEKELNQISDDQPDFLKRAELSIQLCTDTLILLKEAVITKKFKNVEEEVRFFKKIKPKFSCQLVYNILLYDIECRRPMAAKAQLEYFENVVVSLEDYFEKNFEFCAYYRSDSTLLDDKYFVRDNMHLRFVIDEKFFNYDREFNTNRDAKVAHILANDMLFEYTLLELKKVNLKLSAIDNAPVSNIKWTETKAALTILIYSLHTAGCFNGGNTELKELVAAFSRIFNVDLGDFYRTWAEVKLRKDPTKFIDALKDAIQNRINMDMQ